MSCPSSGGSVQYQGSAAAQALALPTQPWSSAQGQRSVCSSVSLLTGNNALEVIWLRLKQGTGQSLLFFFVSLPNLASDFLQNNLQSTTENVMEASTNPSWRKRVGRRSGCPQEGTLWGSSLLLTRHCCSHRPKRVALNSSCLWKSQI